MLVEKGQVLTFTEDELSDYGVEGVCIVNEPFNLEDMKNQWVSECCYLRQCSLNKNRQQYRKSEGQPLFLTWLAKKMLVTPVKYIEVHMGAYGEVDVTFSEKGEVYEN